MRKAVAWAVVAAAAVGGYYVTAWAMLPLIAVLAAHTNPAAASVVVILRLVLWVVLMVVAIRLATRIWK